MARYIVDKKVNLSKANNLSDFDGIGDSIWNFISSMYQAVKIVDGGLYFILLYFFLFNFLFLEQLGLGFISHAVTSITN